MGDYNNTFPMAPGKHISTVKIGPKGQIVIPKEVREMFGVKPGDSMLLLADTERGIAINTIEYFNQIADAAFSAGTVKKQVQDFANAVQTVTKEDK